MIQRKEVFYCKYCPIRKTCFSFLHSQQGSHFFLGGGVHEFYELFPLFCHLCCMCVYVKCWCWYTIEKIFANFEILFQVKIYLIKKRYKLIFTTSWFSFCARSFFFYHYKTLKFYVLCIGREKILYFPARKVLTMLLLSCSLYIHSVTDIDMVITQHISSFVLTHEISVH